MSNLRSLCTIDESVSGEVLVKIATEFFAEMEEKFGTYVHILDWALHLDFPLHRDCIFLFLNDKILFLQIAPAAICRFRL